MAVAVDDAWALASWEAVLARMADPHPFVAPDWQRAWWEHFGAGELEVLRLGDAGVAAVQRAGSTLRFLGNRETTDYPGPAVVPGRAAEAAERLLSHLRAGERLEVDNARPGDGFTASLAGAAGVRVTRELDEPVAVLDLPATWEEYIGGLSRHTRHELARKRRRAGAVAVRTADARTVQADLRLLFVFMQAARGAKGELEATGKRIDVPVLDLFQIRDGVLVEHWALLDNLGMMRQLGALPG